MGLSVLCPLLVRQRPQGSKRETMKPGDTVRIMKPSHPAFKHDGIVMRVEWLDYKGERDQVALVAGVNPIEYQDDDCEVFSLIVKEWPLYVVRLEYLDIIKSCDPEMGWRQAQEIARKLYKRGCALQFPELLNYPNTMSHITG